jgi:hypothetical protein
MGLHACGFVSIDDSAGVSGAACTKEGLFSETPGAPGWIVDLKECSPFCRRAERWFFTSDFLMRLMEAPVRLLAWKVLVWSEAAAAEGEESIESTI